MKINGEIRYEYPPVNVRKVVNSSQVTDPSPLQSIWKKVSSSMATAYPDTKKIKKNERLIKGRGR